MTTREPFLSWVECILISVPCRILQILPLGVRLFRPIATAMGLLSLQVHMATQYIGHGTEERS
jgi:hypothetical protein